MQTTLDNPEWMLTSPIVNVSTVRHLSPFRYPGGKTWLVPKVLETLRDLNSKPTTLVDPFLGGGSVPLAALVEGHVDKVVLCELDGAVAAVWHTIFSRDYQKLCRKILDFKISREAVIEVMAEAPQSTISKAFQTIVKNRTFRGGILANGASLIKVGENGRGVASRWYPETLARRIELLHGFADGVSFIEGDGMLVIAEYAPDPSAFIFVDPPYTAGNGKRAGSRLYSHTELDHEALFNALANGRANFMMTYDDDLDVLRLAKRSGFVLQHVGMKNTHHRCMSELLITRN